MHTETHIQAAGSVDPEAPDDQVAKLHRVRAGEESRLSPHQFDEAFGYPPLCAHGMNSFADGRYDLALARLRHG